MDEVAQVGIYQQLKARSVHSFIYSFCHVFYFYSSFCGKEEEKEKSNLALSSQCIISPQMKTTPMEIL